MNSVNLCVFKRVKAFRRLSHYINRAFYKAFIQLYMYTRRSRDTLREAYLIVNIEYADEYLPKPITEFWVSRNESGVT